MKIGPVKFGKIIMLRYIFCLSIALFCFQFGLFMAFNSDSDPAEPSLAIEEVQISENNFNLMENSAESEIFKGVRFICNDKQLRGFWLDFLKEKEISESISVNKIIYDCSKELKVEQINLSNDKRLKYMVRLQSLSVCSATGNCPQIIFEQKNGKYKQLLYRRATMNFELRSGKTKNYRNLQMYFNLSAYGGYIENFVFDGKQYKVENCFSKQPNSGMEKIKCWNFDNPDE